jgi:hypothetical protein
VKANACSLVINFQDKFCWGDLADKIVPLKVITVVMSLVISQGSQQKYFRLVCAFSCLFHRYFYFLPGTSIADEIKGSCGAGDKEFYPIQRSVPVSHTKPRTSVSWSVKGEGRVSRAQLTQLLYDAGPCILHHPQLALLRAWDNLTGNLHLSVLCFEIRLTIYLRENSSWALCSAAAVKWKCFMVREIKMSRDIQKPWSCSCSPPVCFLLHT